MINPYAILAAFIFWLGSLAGVGWWQHNAGRDAQKAVDQAQFDKINADLSQQKTIAADTYKTAQDIIIQTMAERDKFKTQLETDHAQNIKAITDLRNKYAGVGLRFTTTQSAGCGAGSASPMPSEAGAARITTPTVVQLPESLASNLRALAFDADMLAAEYKKCYEWANHD
jgi:hypothetical protein